MCCRRRKAFIFLSFIFLIPAVNIFPQQQKPANWKAFSFLIGEWVGEGSDAPGMATGSSTFSFGLQDRILIRNSNAEYHAANNRPAFRHDDLMIIYQENQSTKAIYLDNEGHVIHYTANFSPDSIALVLTSDVIPSAPRFRFTYTKLDNERLKVSFEIASPGKPEEFSKYLDGVVKKKI